MAQAVRCVGEATLPVARWLGVGYQACVRTCTRLQRSCRWVMLWELEAVIPWPERQLPTRKKRGEGGSSDLGQRPCQDGCQGVDATGTTLLLWPRHIPKSQQPRLPARLLLACLLPPLQDYSHEIVVTRGTHRKALVVDNCVLIAGSRNVHW